MIRTFIAVDIPNSVREKIAEFQTKLKQHRADIKWTRPESIHITLKFLGNVSEGRIEELTQAVKRAVKGVKAFAVSVEGVGTFPNDRRPRVLWIGVMNGAETLKDLAGRIHSEFTRLGFEKEKREYSPHLTLGRVRSAKNISATVEDMRLMGFEGGSFEAGEVAVMKSDLMPTGAVYTALKKIKLEG